MKIEIAKFALYPKDVPTGYAIGFNITTSNNRMFYTDTIVAFEDCEGINDGGIADIAWDVLEDQINTKVAELELLPTIIGNEWVPTKLQTDTEPTSGV